MDPACVCLSKEAILLLYAAVEACDVRYGTDKFATRGLRVADVD